MSVQNWGAPSPTPRLLAQVGDVAISDQWVFTPNGTWPLAGATFNVLQQPATGKGSTYWWCILLAIGLFPIGLLCLLIKKPVTGGQVQLTVQSQGKWHTTQVYLASYPALDAAMANVRYMQAAAQQALPLG